MGQLKCYNLISHALLGELRKLINGLFLALLRIWAYLIYTFYVGRQLCDVVVLDHDVDVQLVKDALLLLLRRPRHSGIGRLLSGVFVLGSLGLYPEGGGGCGG